MMDTDVDSREEVPRTAKEIINTSNLETDVWLLKVPTALMKEWKQLKEPTRIGSFFFSQVQSAPDSEPRYFPGIVLANPPERQGMPFRQFNLQRTMKYKEGEPISLSLSISTHEIKSLEKFPGVIAPAAIHPQLALLHSIPKPIPPPQIYPRIDGLIHERWTLIPQRVSVTDQLKRYAETKVDYGQSKLFESDDKFGVKLPTQHITSVTLPHNSLTSPGATPRPSPSPFG